MQTLHPRAGSRRLRRFLVAGFGFLALASLGPGCKGGGGGGGGGSASDTTPPSVVETSPIEGAAGVSPTASVTARFSESVAPSSVSSSTFLLDGGSPVAGTVTLSGAVATFQPTGALAYATTYTATLTTGIRDLAGNPLSHTHTWSFTTLAPVDATPPALVSTTPGDGATAVPVDIIPSATFDEPLGAPSFTSGAFGLSLGGTPVAGVVGGSGATVTFTPASALLHESLYTATLTTVIQDVAGNPLPVNLAWTFATAAAVAPPPGSPDTAFGTGGGRAVDFFGGEEEARALAVAPDGRIVAGGGAPDGSFMRAALFRTTAAGELDPTFGVNGKVTTQFGGGNSYLGALAVQPDGKIVAAGMAGPGVATLARYNADGSLDPGFGAAGLLNLALGTSQAMFHGVVIQPDGKIVAAGFSDPPITSGQIGPRLTLVRCLPTGTLDPSFGTGGIVQTLVNGYTTTGRALILQPDGNLLAGGYAHDGTRFVFALARLTPDGALDPSFGTGGFVTTALSTSEAACFGLAIQPDGRIIAAGTSGPSSSSSMVAARFTTAGSLDPSFGTGGVALVGGGGDGAYGVAIQPNGRILMAGGWNLPLVRLLPDGSMDGSYGTGGRTGLPLGGTSFVWAVALQADGKAAVAGFLAYPPAARDMVVARFWP